MLDIVFHCEKWGNELFIFNTSTFLFLFEFGALLICFCICAFGFWLSTLLLLFESSHVNFLYVFII